MTEAKKKSDAASGGNATTATHFIFEHKIFGVPGARFAPTGVERTAALRVQVGDLEASIPLDSLCTEFHIAASSNDGMLIETVKKGLKFVTVIPPGDTIPPELLDGTASWPYDERHGVRARQRIEANIVMWISGRQKMVMNTASILAQHAEKDFKEKLSSGITKLASSVARGPDPEQEVADLINRVVRDLAYIEALRDRYDEAHAIQAKLTKVAQLHRGDRRFTQDIQRVQALMEPPIRSFVGVFDVIDMRMADVEAALKNYDQAILAIREVRDELHERLLIWDEIIDRWDIDVDVRSARHRPAVQMTYQFVASRFPQSRDWL